MAFPSRIELAAARMGSMTAVELRDRLEHRFRLLVGAELRPDRQRTLHQLVSWSYDMLSDDERRVLLAASVFAGGFDLASLAELADDDDDVETLASSRRVGAPFARRRRSAGRRDEISAARDDPPVRRRSPRRRRERRERASARSACCAVRARGRSALGAVERRRLAVDLRLGRDRAVQSSCRLPMERRARQLRGRNRCGGPLGTDRGTGPVVRNSHMGRGVTRRGNGCGRDTPSPAVHRRRLCLLSRVDRPHAAEHARTATELAALPGYDACEPGLSTFIEALARVYCGDLERYVELSEQVARLAGPAQAFGLPAYVDGLQASGRVEEALALTEESVSAARDVGNPFWIAYALWTAGLAHANTDPRRALAAWNEGVDVVQQHRVNFFEGFLARDAARVHALAGEPLVALDLFATAIESFQQAGNIAQLIITVALVPGLFEQVGHRAEAASLHAAITRERASVDHVPELADLAGRLESSLGLEDSSAVPSSGEGSI